MGLAGPLQRPRWSTLPNVADLFASAPRLHYEWGNPMARIRVVGSDEVVTEAPIGTNLLAALQGAQHPITTSCGGRATCGLCRLTVVQGRELLRPVNDDEVGHLGNVAKVVDIRLACQSVVVADGDIELDIPPVVDVAARKREQTRRGMAERASRRNNQAGRGGKPPTDAEPRRPPERIEWRPRKLAEDEAAAARRRKRH